MNRTVNSVIQKYTKEWCGFNWQLCSNRTIILCMPCITVVSSINRLVFISQIFECLLWGRDWIYMYLSKWHAGRRPFTVTVRVWSKASGGRRGTGKGFSPSTSVFPCQYHSTNAPDSSSSTRCSYQKDKWTKPGNLPKKKQRSFGNREAFDIIAFLLFFVKLKF